MIEWAYVDKMWDAAVVTGNSRLEHEEMVAFSGRATYAEGVVMVCPELLEHVKTVVEEDAAIRTLIVLSEDMRAEQRRCCSG